MKEQAMKVEIQSSKTSSYAQIVRACISACNACRKTGDEEQLRNFLKLWDWASGAWMATL